ncbi:alpha/beta fold hydrolase [Rhodococcus jostii]|uniref:Pimeloyl-ACP methyl ester carboxylesterase n=1 Tax=Rhodococcus jostii TaxID=132919 RepID=A0A1H5M5A4_RHOJO|nr:alpha/beta hydrolase [Rhodococcus jostii]SEE83957.1 Pimeloyl-ACP methyl ester carboxylesterase [Rhodococcus jostii]
MKRQPSGSQSVEQRMVDAERELFAGLGTDVDEFFIELGQTGRRVRVLSHGRGPTVVLLHGVSLSAAVWAPLFTEFPQFRLLAVDLPGHGLSDPISFGRGQVREHASRLIDDILDALGLDEVPVIGHSLGGMFALWYVAGGSRRISALVAIGMPAVALAGVRVRMPLSLMTVPGLGPAFLRSPTPRPVYRRLLARGLGPAEVAAAPDALIEALRLSARRRANARTVASLMHAIDRFRQPRAESVLTGTELAAIRIPTIFVLGSDDPYLSVDRARLSIQKIPGATIHEVLAGHGPWLVDPHSAALLATEFLASRSDNRLNTSGAAADIGGASKSAPIGEGGLPGASRRSSGSPVD